MLRLAPEEAECRLRTDTERAAVASEPLDSDLDSRPETDRREEAEREDDDRDEEPLPRPPCEPPPEEPPGGTAATRTGDARGGARTAPRPA
ncbi:hypothetical protein GCM10020000_53950 [Streptomyces olivoverticillatus]